MGKSPTSLYRLVSVNIWRVSKFGVWVYLPIYNFCLTSYSNIHKTWIQTWVMKGTAWYCVAVSEGWFIRWCWSCLPGPCRTPCRVSSNCPQACSLSFSTCLCPRRLICVACIARPKESWVGCVPSLKDQLSCGGPFPKAAVSGFW